MATATSLGKRKRESVRPQKKVQVEPVSDDDVRARFQKAFEAKFKPLPKEELKVEVLDEESDEDLVDEKEEDDDEDWDGFSEDDVVEIVQHSTGQDVDRLAERREMKAFMSSRPPTSLETKRPSTKKMTTTTDDDDTESANLKNDLALQRLLKESHLLDPTSFAKNSSTAPEGKARIKALDLRLQDLGVKQVVEKMPMSHRKGINAKADQREKSRRKEAAENGIILERATATPKKSARLRDRGIGAPSVGKFQGGTLKLSGKDVRSIKQAGKGPMKRRR